MPSLLDRFDNIRRVRYDQANEARFAVSPLNRNAYGGEAGYQYRRQEEAYGTALRQLRRAARRGDTGAALQEIAVRERAMGQGFTPGGIRDRREFNADREAWQAGNARLAGDARLAARLNRRRAYEQAADTTPDQTGDPGMDQPDFGGDSQTPWTDWYNRRHGTSIETMGAGPDYGDTYMAAARPESTPVASYAATRRRLGDPADQQDEPVRGTFRRLFDRARSYF